jgi:hypothetical protein
MATKKTPTVKTTAKAKAIKLQTAPEAPTIVTEPGVVPIQPEVPEVNLGPIKELFGKLIVIVNTTKASSINMFKDLNFFVWIESKTPCYFEMSHANFGFVESPTRLGEVMADSKFTVYKIHHNKIDSFINLVTREESLFNDENLLTISTKLDEYVEMIKLGSPA